MSLSRPQAGASANTTNVAITSTTQGDLILVFAYNATNNTIPTLPAGFTSLGTAQTATGAARLGYKKSAGADVSSGTWTNATRVACLVFRSSSGYCVPGAVPTFMTGTGTTLTYPGMTAANGANHFRTDGASWIAGFGGARSATAGMNGSTTNLTNETNQTTVNGLDSEAVKASFANETLEVTTSGEWIAATVEVAEVGGEATVSAGMGMTQYCQPRQGYIPGYVRRVNLPGDWYGVLAGGWGQVLGASGAAGAPVGTPRVAEGTDGVNFGMGTIGQHERTDVGSPTPPSQIQRGPGRVLMLVPVLAGSRTISLSARWSPDSGAGYRPRLVLRRSLEMGVSDDTNYEAASFTAGAFTTITITRTVPANGIFEIWREQQDQRADAWTLWDNLQVS